MYTLVTSLDDLGWTCGLHYFIERYSVGYMGDGFFLLFFLRIYLPFPHVRIGVE